MIKKFKDFLNESGFKDGSRNPTKEEIQMCKDPKGFTQINHCKALGLIKRADDTKEKSKKYGGKE